MSALSTLSCYHGDVNYHKASLCTSSKLLLSYKKSQVFTYVLKFSLPPGVHQPPQTKRTWNKWRAERFRQRIFKLAGEEKNLYQGYFHSLGNDSADKALLILRSRAQEQQCDLIHNVCCSVCESSHGRCSMSVFICQIKASDGEAPFIIKGSSTVAFCQIRVARGNGQIKHVLRETKHNLAL